MTQHERFCRARECRCPHPMRKASDNIARIGSDSDGNLEILEGAVSGLAAFPDAWQKVGVAESRNGQTLPGRRCLPGRTKRTRVIARAAGGNHPGDRPPAPTTLL